MLRSREHKSEFHDFKLLAESKFCGGCISSYNLGVWSHRFGWGCLIWTALVGKANEAT